MNSRLEKLKKLKESGKNPYPRDFPGRETIYNAINSPETSKPDEIHKIAGRISARRDHGDNIFFDIFDQTGSIQLHAKWEKVNGDIDDNFRSGVTNKIWKDIQECDLGDCVGVEGTLSENKRGELLLLISNWTLLAKALIEPPDKHHGITDLEVKYRHRERELLSSADSRALFKTRAEIIFEIRKYLNERDYVEIETPVLQSIYGGATAKPFSTKHNALGQEFFLSISSELFIKRTLVGGFDRVYSMSRCFRNEGISPEHNPEFTNLEIFETCKTDLDMIKFVEDLIEYAAHSVGSLVPPIKIDADLPSDSWPLSRKSIGKGKHKNRADAWEMFSENMEIASGASDLNDPFEQSERLLNGRISADDIIPDEDYMPNDPYDKNYIEALECGALPWAGVGIGIDRLVMLLTGKTNIRDVIAFPTLRST